MKIYNDCPEGNCNTNFRAVKNVSIEGKSFKKNPELSKFILDELKRNKKFQEFSEKYNVDVVLFSPNKEQDAAANLILLWKNPYLSSAKKFFNELFGKKEKFEIQGYSNIGFRDACYRLITDIAETDIFGKKEYLPTGVLTTNLGIRQHELEEMAQNQAQKAKEIAKRKEIRDKKIAQKRNTDARLNEIANDFKKEMNNDYPPVPPLRPRKVIII